jgi:hypothetical protein
MATSGYRKNYTLPCFVLAEKYMANKTLIILFFAHVIHSTPARILSDLWWIGNHYSGNIASISISLDQGILRTIGAINLLIDNCGNLQIFVPLNM